MESITMSFVDFSRNQIGKLLTKENNMILENKVPLDCTPMGGQIGLGWSDGVGHYVAE
jgi:hypothetical protein